LGPELHFQSQRTFTGATCPPLFHFTHNKHYTFMSIQCAATPEIVVTIHSLIHIIRIQGTGIDLSTHVRFTSCAQNKPTHTTRTPLAVEHVLHVSNCALGKLGQRSPSHVLSTSDMGIFSFCGARAVKRELPESSTTLHASSSQRGLILSAAVASLSRCFPRSSHACIIINRDAISGARALTRN